MAFTKLEPNSVNTSATFTFANANVTGNLDVSGLTNLGPASNITIDGGSDGHILSTDGSGNLSWVENTGGGIQIVNGFTGISRDSFVGDGTATQFTLTSIPTDVDHVIINIDGILQQSAAFNLSGNVVTFTGTPLNGEVIEVTTYLTGGQTTAGSNTQIQFNNNGNLGASSNLTFNRTTNVLKASFLQGDGYMIGNIRAANIYGEVPSSHMSGTVFTNAQPNITSVGTLTGLTVNGNITATRFFGDGSQLTGVSTSGVSDPAGSNTQIQFNDNGTTAGDGNLTFNKTSRTLSATFLAGNGSSVTNVNAVSLNGHPDTYFASTLYVDSAVSDLVGGAPAVLNTLNELANALGNDASFTTTITNSLANKADTSDLAAVAISGDYTDLSNTPALFDGEYASLANKPALFSGSYTDLTNKPTLFDGEYSSLANKPTLFSGSYTDLTNKPTIISTANTVTDATQSNITSVGTLTGLVSTGVVNLAGASNVNLGVVSNIHITGGISGQVLSTDGAGQLSWITATTGGGGGTSTVAGADTQIQFNYAGDFGASGSLVFDYANNKLITSNADLGNLVTANYFSGSGNNLSNIQGANITGAVGLATYATTANSVAGANVSGQVANALVATTAVTANSVAGANVSGQVANALVAGTVYTNAQPNITSVGTLTNLGINGNLVVGGNLTVNGTVTSINSTIVQVDDLALVLANDASSSTLANGAGIIINGASANMLYINSTNSFTFSHKISADGSLLTSLPGANISGQVANALVASTVYTNAQPNITSVGSLTGLTVSNATGVVNFTTTANVTLGSVGNLHIAGGTSGQYLRTDGSGTLSWASVAGGTSSIISNGTSNVSVSTSGGEVTTSVAGVANVLSVSSSGAEISGNLTVTTKIVAGSGSGGSITGVNEITANYFIGAGNNLSNIQGANVTGQVSYAAIANAVAGANVSGAVTYATTANSVAGANVSGQVANALVAETVTSSAQPNITSVGMLTGLNVAGNTNFTTGFVTFQATQDVTLSSSPSGLKEYDLTTGSVFDVTTTASWSINLINVPTTTNRTTIVTFIVTQGATGYLPTDFQIAGASQTIKWISSTAPTASSNKIDVVSYSLIRSSSGTWTVLGQSASYG